MSRERPFWIPGSVRWSRFQVFPEAWNGSAKKKSLSGEDATGLMTLPDAACRPVLRNVPRFPSEAVAPGDSWTLPAEEVHVFRFSGEYYGPYRGQVRVFYRYLENVDTPLGPAARLSLEYNVYLPIHSPTEPVSLLSGQSKQEVLWDISLGRPISKSEDFEFFMMTSDGSTREFTGTTETIYRYTNFLNRQQEAEQIKKDFNDRAEVGIETVEEGILLTLSEEAGNILFLPDSAVISEDQKKLLSDLAESLSTYTDRDILITGHTADYGTPEGRESLSFQRAAAVAGELFPQGRKGPGRLYLRGAGSSEPAGRDSENRRVEILILD